MLVLQNGAAKVSKLSALTVFSSIAFSLTKGKPGQSTIYISNHLRL